MAASRLPEIADPATLPLHSLPCTYPADSPTKWIGKHMSNPKEHPSADRQSNAANPQRSAEFLKQVKAEEVPSGLRPDLAPPGADGEGSDGGGVGSSL
jgi:hypothetical protein